MRATFILLTLCLLVAACGDPEPGDTVVVYDDHGGFTTYKISDQGTRVAHGVCEVRQENGALWMRETYVEGKKEGMFERWDSDGRKVEESEFRADRQHGWSVMWFPDGDTIVRSWYVDGYQHGPYWVTNYAGDVRGVTTHIKGQVHGVSMNLSDDQSIVETRVILHGQGVSAVDERPLSEIQFYSR